MTTNSSPQTLRAREGNGVNLQQVNDEHVSEKKLHGPEQLVTDGGDEDDEDDELIDENTLLDEDDLASPINQRELVCDSFVM